MVRIPVTAAQLREYEVGERGPTALLDATAALADHIRKHTPGDPGPVSRLAALDDLVRFKQRLDAASLAFTRRSRTR
jgi:hypothetical protein